MQKFKKFFLNNKSGYSTTAINHDGYGYGSQFGGMYHIYGYDNEGNIFGYVVTPRRCQTILQLLDEGKWWDIDKEIRENYSTNGYTTRCGVKKALSKLERIKKIAQSHDACKLGGKDGHDYRVSLRNR